MPSAYCDPGACIDSCEESCGYHACWDGGVWKAFTWKLPLSCLLEDCALPIELPFGTYGKLELPLDADTGACGNDWDPALSFATDSFHGSHVTAAGGWDVVAASGGELYPNGPNGGGVLMSVPLYSEVTLLLESPTGKHFDLAFAWKNTLHLLSVDPAAPPTE